MRWQIKPHNALEYILKLPFNIYSIINPKFVKTGFTLASKVAHFGLKKNDISSISVSHPLCQPF
jgi:hypothetical protein